jgi:hypothetical protein
MKDPSHILWWPVYLFVIVITILALSAPGENKSTTSTDSSVEERELPEVSH